MLLNQLIGKITFALKSLYVKNGLNVIFVIITIVLLSFMIITFDWAPLLTYLSKKLDLLAGRSENTIFVFGIYLAISLTFFCLLVRLFSYRETRGVDFVRAEANKILDFFIIFLIFFELFFLLYVQNLFSEDMDIADSFLTWTFATIGHLDKSSVALQVIVGFSFIIFLVILRLSDIQFDPFVVLLFVLINPFLIFLCFAQNMIYFFVFFEGFALVTTLLIVISGHYNGIKVPRYDVLVYLIYSLAGTSLMTLGLVIIFIWTGGLISFFEGNLIFRELSVASVTSEKSATLVFFLVSLNIFFKLGVFPFQNWILPVYNSLNTPVLFYVVLFSKFVVSLVFIFKFFPAFFVGYINWICFAVAIVSMVFGVYFGLATVKLREIIGASSIVNYGVVMLLISYAAPKCAIFYMICYTVTLFNMMICLLPYKNRDNGELVEATNIINYHPKSTSRGFYFDFYVVFSVAALMGLPPFLFFYAKIYVLTTLVGLGTVGAYVMGVFFLLVNVLSAVYYLRLLFGFIKGSIVSWRADLLTCYHVISENKQKYIKILFFLTLLLGICFFYYIENLPLANYEISFADGVELVTPEAKFKSALTSDQIIQFANFPLETFSGCPSSQLIIHMELVKTDQPFIFLLNTDPFHNNGHVSLFTSYGHQTVLYDVWGITFYRLDNYNC